MRFFLAVFVLLAAISAFAMPAINDFPPFRIADNLYFIGNDFDASYLVVTPKGNIIINSGYAERLPQLKASIEKLGFNYADTKIILVSHGHIDHAGASQLIREQTGAKLMAMKQDQSILESGGKSDFVYGSDPDMIFPPTHVDHLLKDGEQVKLGGVTLTAHLTSGHTPGCTTWTMQVSDHHHFYHVVIFGSTSVNTGYQLVNNKAYPNITNDYLHSFKVLKALPCDIFLGSHGMFYDIKSKFAQLKTNTENPFINKNEYKKFVMMKEAEFHKELIKQQKQSSETKI